MEKIKGSIIAILLAVVAALGGGITFDKMYGGVGVNLLEDLTITATTTGSYASNVPVKILSRDSDRSYALIVNAGATAVYLYPLGSPHDYNFTGMASGYTSVTSTIDELDGIYLSANGGSYEIIEDNLIIDEFWVSSTASGVQINTIYK